MIAKGGAMAAIEDLLMVEPAISRTTTSYKPTQKVWLSTIGQF
jgi:hypothetical protein